MAIDKRLQVFNEEGQSVDYDILASDVKFLPDGKDLPTKLAEMEQEIEEAGSGDGTVTGVKVGSTTHEPTEGVVDLSEPFNDKVDKETGKELIPSTDLAKLQSLPTATELGTQLGQKANDNAVVKTVTINGETKQPQNGNVSFNVQAGGESVVINSDGADIVDSHTNPSILVAPSARQMYMAAQNIDTLFRKVNDLYDKLAGIAFTDGKPANWKEYVDWSSVTIPTHTITLGTMTNVTASLNDTPISDSTSATEGEVTLKLTPAQDTMILTENISIKLGTKDVPFTTSADNDSTLVTFVLAGDVTITASASSGIGVQVNGNNVSANVNGIALTGDNRTIILSHPNHFEWDGGIGLSVNSVALVENTDYTLVSNQDGTKTITVLKTFTSDAYPIVITASVVEDDHAILDLTNVGSGVTVNKANNAHVYVGDTITILPASGNKVTASATIGGNAATLTGDTYAGYSYTIGSGDVSSGGTTIAITAVGAALDTFSIGLTVTSDVGVTWTNPSAAAQTILEGSPFKITLAKVSGTGSLQVGTCTMAGGTLTPNNGVIETDHVTGNITIAASVEEVFEPDMVHSWGYEPETDSNNKRYLPDAKGDFWLYNQSDAGLNSVYVPGGCYGNTDSSVTNTNAGYGSHRTLYGGNNFTIRVKHFEIVQRTDSGAGVNAYLSYQKSVKMFSSGELKYAPGQFRLKLTSSNGSGSTSSSFCIGIDYGYNSSSESVYFNQQMTAVSDNNIHDYFITYDSTTNKVSCYRATIDPNGVSATTVVKCGEAEPQTALKFRLVAYKPEESNINGVDIYNYAMTQAQVEGLFGITNND